MLLQNMLPAVLKNPPQPAGIAAAHSQQVATPTSNILTATPPRINHHPTVSFKKRVCQNLVPHTPSITALARERELVSLSPNYSFQAA